MFLFFLLFLGEEARTANLNYNWIALPFRVTLHFGTHSFIFFFFLFCCWVFRFFATACVATTIAMEFRMIDPFYLVLDWGMVFTKFQIWRLVTCFFIIGGFSWNFLMRIILIHNYGVALEKGVFQFKTAEFLYLWLFGACTLLAVSLALPGFQLIVLNGPFVFMLLYIWSKHYPTQSVSIMGLFQVQGFYLPWAFLMINMVLGGSPWQDLFGIFAGHL